eukprot:1627839-Rhodomonas_salina.1
MLSQDRVLHSACAGHTDFGPDVPLPNGGKAHSHLLDRVVRLRSRLRDLQNSLLAAPWSQTRGKLSGQEEKKECTCTTGCRRHGAAEEVEGEG